MNAIIKSILYFKLVDSFKIVSSGMKRFRRKAIELPCEILNPESRGNFSHSTCSTKFAFSCHPVKLVKYTVSYRMCKQVKCTRCGWRLLPDTSRFPFHTVLVSALQYRSLLEFLTAVVWTCARIAA